jgi:hypothetical protein
MLMLLRTRARVGALATADASPTGFWLAEIAGDLPPRGRDSAPEDRAQDMTHSPPTVP